MRAGWLGIVLCGCLAASPQRLVDDLGGGRCVQAYAELEARQDASAATAIAGGLSHANPRIRSQCLRLLAGKQDTQWLPRIVALLSDPDPSVHQQAARTLLHLMDTSEMVELLETSEAKGPGQVFLIVLLLKEPTELSHLELQDWVLKPHPLEMELRIFRVLRDSWGPRAAYDLRDQPELTAALEKAHQRVAALALRRAMESANPVELRGLALTLYANFQGPDSLATLLRFQAEGREPWREEACLAAQGWSQAPAAGLSLSRVACDPRQPLRLRVTATRGLGRLIRSPEARRTLLSLLDNQEPELRYRAVSGLGHIGDAECLPALGAIAADGRNPRLQARAREAIRRVEHRLRNPW